MCTGTLYYLLDMCDGGEVWKRLTVDGKVVGAHPSLSRFWLSEVVSAMEHMHRRGLVHRDLKVLTCMCDTYIRNKGLRCGFVLME